ncbi:MULTISPECIES: H-type small acid-soluble spore protein [Thermoactinomyces]|jgi:small acid-soluble spore protein H (minor)|uniref:H-type small acid-soluble spore protein n=1 Tax=Thermoactinomyces daqus TaxID=1329516 RepID=A0A7W1X7H3_9BACL|nr:MULTISPECIES: H-type small acid-soluble spore protein [Thermoactinomyces]MBA4541462.1 H-type small acid-soluble spore protein [Thermoactinomyces daqus]MBH8596935.1 H-type small acid-soluble spore protein [Thermoactinomyces sp. CICC 10523]MBH8603711.1 H-type small acid-soluble spore protein [Thermoactinomyces sp. CICC 10522]
MDLERAKEILKSPEHIEVTYRGRPVWIEMVDEHAEKAQVHEEVNKDNVMIVPVWDLEDKG